MEERARSPSTHPLVPPSDTNGTVTHRAYFHLRPSDPSINPTRCIPSSAAIRAIRITNTLVVVRFGRCRGTIFEPVRGTTTNTSRSTRCGGCSFSYGLCGYDVAGGVRFILDIVGVACTSRRCCSCSCRPRFCSCYWAKGNWSAGRSGCWILQVDREEKCQSKEKK